MGISKSLDVVRGYVLSGMALSLIAPSHAATFFFALSSRGYKGRQS